MEPHKEPDALLGRFGGILGLVGAVAVVLLVAWLLGIIF